MTNIANISSKFDEMIPLIEKDFVSWVTAKLEVFVAMEPKKLRELPHQWGQEAGMWRQLRQFCISVDEDGNRSNRFTNRYAIDHARIAVNATRYATDQVESFKAKLEKKLVDLTEVTTPVLRGLDFEFSGKLGGHKVFVEQRTILKCSSKGTLFNQWPCRIYVDGKFTSEAKFKKLAV